MDRSGLVAVNRNDKAGFTLAEIGVVVTIVGLLLSISIMGARTYRDRAKAVKCLAQLRGMGNALQVYATEHEGFLPSINEYNTELAPDGGLPAMDIRYELYTYDPMFWNMTCPADFRNRNNPDPLNPSYLSYSYDAQYGLNLERCSTPLALVSDAIFFHGREGSWKRASVFTDNHAELEPWR